MKGSLSSFELRRVIEELQFLVGGKIEKIFQQEKPIDDFLFSLHIPGKGKQYLFLSLPKVICLSSFKPVFPLAPPGFCTGLRRKITNARITAISQHHFERIVKIGLMTKQGPSTLIIEFLSPGNIILVNEENKILSVLHPKIWSEQRRLLPAKQYAFPPQQLDPAALSLLQFTELIKQSKKESLVKFLAIECSLGGVYAEEVVHRAGVEKNQSPAKLSDENTQKVYAALHELFAQKTEAFIFNNEAFPLALAGLSQENAFKGSFNEAVAQIALADLTSQEKETANKEATSQLSKTGKIIALQEQALQGLERKEKENQHKGELLYTHYAEIKLVLDKVTQLRKVASWSEIKELTKDIDIIERIDEKTGSIFVNVE